MVKPWSHDWLIAARAYPGFCSMKRLGVFLLPLDRMRVHHRSLPYNLLGFPNKSQVAISTPGWREALWECLAQKHNTVSPARIWTQNACSRDENTNHEATTPPTLPKLELSFKSGRFDDLHGRPGDSMTCMGDREIWWPAWEIGRVGELHGKTGDREIW